MPIRGARHGIKAGSTVPKRSGVSKKEQRLQCGVLRLLIARAENAADSLELAAMTSPKAHLSLIEARKLVAEAIQFLESCHNPDVSAVAGHSRTDRFSYFPTNSKNQTSVTATGKDFAFGDFPLHNSLKKGDAFLSACSRPAVFESTRADGKLGPTKYDDQVTMNSTAEPKSHPQVIEARHAESATEKGVVNRTLATKKKWVCGKFVVVAGIE
ncbi:hypothetical protein MLD38_004781 [Melastoma candidum]|uniref:Uncharacterized protein n=1 Tax=Melastoma candidum TaxID=119954 RepID=A0ACB9S788_9MYRT|nr:hypothetical protein MLD38_004781 [Melastoma candidum]